MVYSVVEDHFVNKVPVPYRFEGDLHSMHGIQGVYESSKCDYHGCPSSGSPVRVEFFSRQVYSTLTRERRFCKTSCYM